MDVGMAMPIEERIFLLLEHLGVKQAHFAARDLSDWQAFTTKYPELVSSLILVCPRASETRSLSALGSRLLVFTGDQGNESETLLRGLEEVPDSTVVTLQDYLPNVASDIVSDRKETLGTSMLDFLAGIDREREKEQVSPAEGEGQVAEILYRIQGTGPPLVLCPLQYSPSQWDHLIEPLSQNYCTISLGGAHIGSVGNLETRAKGGYLDAVKRVVDETALQPGERVLDVGCGPGSLDRWIAYYTDKANPITGLDPSTYLLREGAAMVKSEQLESLIDFREGKGDALPFPDSDFNVAMSFTAMQYVDADKMIKEMIRVIKPGGRVAVLARGDDEPFIINTSLPDELKAKAESQRSKRSNERGCNDASLYRRFHQAGLTQIKMFPQLAIYTDSSDGARLQDILDRIIPSLTLEEAEVFRHSIAQAHENGGFFIAEPFHCAVGTRVSV